MSRHFRKTKNHKGFSAGIFVAAAFFMAGCPPAETPNGGNGTNGGAGNGENGGEEPAPIAINVAANDNSSQSPFDATLSPDGTIVYFAGLTPGAGGDLEPAIFSTPADGGTPTLLASGDPLAGPMNLDINFAGDTLFVADSAALEDDDTGEVGAILTVATAGGSAAALSGTEGYGPNGVVIQKVDDTEWIYFTGTDPTSGTPGLFRVGLSGGTPEALLTGSPLSDPGGVATATDGIVYVVDSSPEEAFARVIKVEGGNASVLLSDIGVGFPAGIALLPDDSAVLVSGINPLTQTDIVYILNLATGEVSTLEDPVSAFEESAGLHRAHDANAFAWADSEANGTGTVYVLRP
jgi:sugar lactone lactonase YvrE